MRITAVHIENFKRIEDVRITPDADRTIILLGGKNRQGKSSTLDALTAAFGGKKTLPSDPVRHGAEQAEILVELDSGELSIRRVIQPDGESVLEVRDRLGAIKSPQAALDKLIGTRFLDPVQFLALPSKEQRAALMRLIPEAARIAELEGKRERAFAKRTEVGRKLTDAKGELARLPDVKVGQPINVTAISAQKDKIVAVEREVAQLMSQERDAARAVEQERTRIAKVQADIEAKRQAVEALQKQIADLDAHLDAADAHLAELTKRADEAKQQRNDAADSLSNLAPLRAELDQQLEKADEHNRSVYAAEAQAKRRADVAQAVTELATEVENITKALGVIDDRKADILAAAKLPVDGLGVSDDGVTLDGIPLAQASGAERYRVALALAIAGSPGLDDVWIRDGALFDEEHLQLVADHAAAAGKRVWVERVGTSDPGVIVISDGKVVAESEAA